MTTDSATPPHRPDAPRRAVHADGGRPKVLLIVGIALVLVVGGLAVYAYTLNNRG